MTYLVVCLGSGKGTWAHLDRLVKSQEWEKIFFITTEIYSGKFPVQASHEFIVINTEKPLKELVSEIKSKLDGKIADTEVALSLISGSGKEHMAILAALLKVGLGIRLVAFTGKESEEI